MAEEIISRSISVKIWDQAGVELANLDLQSLPVRHVSAVRHITDCATQPGDYPKIDYDIVYLLHKMVEL